MIKDSVHNFRHAWDAWHDRHEFGNTPVHLRFTGACKARQEKLKHLLNAAESVSNDRQESRIFALLAQGLLEFIETTTNGETAESVRAMRDRCLQTMHRLLVEKGLPAANAYRRYVHTAVSKSGHVPHLSRYLETNPTEIKCPESQEVPASAAIQKPCC